MFQSQEDVSNEELSSRNKGINAMRAASQIAFENGTADMTLDEINEEISKSRKHETEE